MPRPSNTRKRFRSLALRLGASVILVILVFRSTQVDFGEIWKNISGANVTLLVLAMLSIGLGYVLSTYRWRILLEAVGIRIPMPLLLSSFAISRFFANYLPTSVAGDIFRAYDASRYSDVPVAKTLAVGMVDRLTGFFSLLAVASVAFLAGTRTLGLNRSIFVALVVGYLIIIGFLLVSRFRTPAEARFPSKPAMLKRAADQLGLFQGALREFDGHRRELGRALLIALVLQINVVVYYYLISLALQQQVPLGYFLLFIPILMVVLQVAPSINGIGIREAGFVLFLTPVGVAAGSAIALSLIAFVLGMLASAMGGLIFVLRTRARPPADERTGLASGSEVEARSRPQTLV